MSVLREVLARFGIEVDEKPLEALSGSVDGMVGRLKKLGGALASGLAVKALVDFTVEMSDVGGELDDTATRLGITTTSLQAWRHAAQLSGVEAGALDGAMGILQRTLAGAAEGNKEAGDTFRELGVNVKDGHGQIRSLDDLLPDIAEGLSKVENPTKRAGLAMKVFGRSGAQLLPLVADGAAGVAQLREEFNRLGGGMGEETVKSAAELNDNLDRMNQAIFSVKARVAGVLMPILNRLVEVAIKLVSGFQQVTAQTHVVEAALIVLGVAMAAMAIKTLVAFAPLIATAAMFALGIAFIILLVDDLLTLFSGGKSLIGGFIDEMLGAGTAAALVRDLKDAWEGVLLAVHDATVAVKDFFGLEVDAADRKPPDQATDPAVLRARQARALAAQGTITRNPDETWAQARARFDRDRAELAGAGRQATVTPRARAVTIQPPVGAGKGQTTQVDARTTATIQVAPGTDAAQLERMRRVVGDVMDERNRAAQAALTQEAVPE